MEVKKRSEEKRGGVKLGLGGLGGGGGGLVVVIGGALVAATVWSFCEFRRRRKPSCKKGTLKDFQTPSLGIVKNVDGGGHGLGVILQNSKGLIDVDERQTQEKDASAQNLLLDVEKRSKLGMIEEEEEEIQEGRKTEDDKSFDGNMVLFQKKDGVVCEDVTVDETMHESLEFCADSLDADTLSSVSDEDLSVSEIEVTESKDDGIMLVEKVEVAQFATLDSFDDDGIMCETKGDEVVQFMTKNTVVDDGSNDAVSEDFEYEGEDGIGSEAASSSWQRPKTTQFWNKTA